MFTKQEVKQRIAEWRQAGRELPLYNLACFIADCALIDKRDKGGVDYAFHTSAVSLHHTDSLTKQIIGKLHDVVEDSDWGLDDLRDAGFPERIVAGVDGMTHREGELYFDSIERCALNPDSVDGKIKDLRHNLSGSRNNWLPTEKDMERQRKYTVAYNYLVSVKKGEILPGTAVGVWMELQPARLQDMALLARHSSRYADSGAVRHSAAAPAPRLAP